MVSTGSWSQVPTGTPIFAHLASSSTRACSGLSVHRHLGHRACSRAMCRRACCWGEGPAPQAQGSTPASTLLVSVWGCSGHHTKGTDVVKLTSIPLGKPRPHSVTQAVSLGDCAITATTSALHTCLAFTASRRTRILIQGCHCLQTVGSATPHRAWPASPCGCTTNTWQALEDNSPTHC